MIRDRLDIIPIPLRADFTARVHIPEDITPLEARKIGAVLLAYAQAIEARRAETPKSGSVEDESAVGSADAPMTSPASQKGVRS